MLGDGLVEVADDAVDGEEEVVDERGAEGAGAVVVAEVEEHGEEAAADGLVVVLDAGELVGGGAGDADDGDAEALGHGAAGLGAGAEGLGEGDGLGLVGRLVVLDDGDAHAVALDDLRAEADEGVLDEPMLVGRAEEAAACPVGALALVDVDDEAVGGDEHAARVGGHAVRRGLDDAGEAAVAGDADLGEGAGHPGGELA